MHVRAAAVCQHITATVRLLSMATALVLLYDFICIYLFIYSDLLFLLGAVKPDLVQNTKCRLFDELWKIAAFRSMCF